MVKKVVEDQWIIDKNLFNGHWQNGHAAQLINVYNPLNNHILASIEGVNDRDIQKSIDASHKAFQQWSRTSVDLRCQILSTWAKLLKEQVSSLSRVITLESGKPLKESEAEIFYSASYLEWFANESLRAYGDVIPHDDDRRIIISKEPLGVCASITPWNFPMAMLARKVAPCLAAGSTMIVKPSELTPLSAFAFAKLGLEAGLPNDVISVIVGDAAQIGHAFAHSDIVRKLSFTGSTRVGQLLYENSATTVKKLSLELGGNAPMIILEDADIDHAVSEAMNSKFRFSGQTCVCVNRLYVHRKVYTQFQKKLASKMKKLVLGDGLDPKTTMGPLINKYAIDKVERLVEEAKSRGAHVVLGGQRHYSDQHFYEPTILGQVPETADILHEEIFGPVVTLIPFDDENAVIEAANNTPYGLAAYVFGQHADKLWRISRSLEFGMVGINSGLISNVKCPFGGVKYSGFGREGSKYGLDEYMYIKYINWQLGPKDHQEKKS